MQNSVPVRHPADVAVADCVTFRHDRRVYVGYVRKKGRSHASVVCDDGHECRVPYQMLAKLPHAPRKHVQSRSERLRLQFHVNDRVTFPARRRSREGVITRLNPKRAHVVCGNDDEFLVPYERLTRVAAADDAAGQPPRPGSEALDEVARYAQQMLRQHGLARWSFQFDAGTRRAGSCQYDTRVITLSTEYARYLACRSGKALNAEIQDTLLHEIAHALVGKQHNHDAVWQAKAREIGCSSARCHDVRFTPPRYIMKCANGCWVATAERRRRNLVCSRCHGPIQYLTYTADRWQREQAAR